MFTYHLLVLGFSLLLLSLSARAQTDNLLHQTERVTQGAQQRIDSLRQVLKATQDQSQAYHDSVLHHLNARRDSLEQRAVVRKADSVVTNVQGMHQAVREKLPAPLAADGT